MTTNDQKFIRPNSTYDVSGAMDRAALQQRRIAYVTAQQILHVMAEASRRLWAFSSQMALPHEHLKSRIR